MYTMHTVDRIVYTDTGRLKQEAISYVACALHYSGHLLEVQ